jgi:hypothetical protein
VPTVILFRMLVNLLIDALFGAVPVLGDFFDVFHRAARKNLELLQRHSGVHREKPRVVDYAVLGLVLLCLLGLLFLPVALGLVVFHLIATLGG